MQPVHPCQYSAPNPPLARVCNACRYIELRERSSIRFYKQEILQTEKIFMLENEEEYQSKITAYVFRDLKLVGIGRKAKLRYLLQSIWKPEVTLDFHIEVKM